MTPALGRILRSADFVRVLGIPACARSAHFAIHFLDGQPKRLLSGGTAISPGLEPVRRELSTDGAPSSAQLVDDSASTVPPRANRVWLGAVVPKRHARRSVTRSLIRRQIQAALLRRDAPGQPPLRPGLWVVRLRAPFDRAVFTSASSAALRGVARGELDTVLGQAGRKLAVALPALPGVSGGACE